MATIVLSSVGSLFGPLGKFAGTLAGNAIDNALFGPTEIEGSRLTELAVTTSSYGTPIPWQFGTIRTPGTLVWSTDLQENRESHSNGKGQPRSAIYTYSVSFAVLLSSGPIHGLGRIWADGNLLRGAEGDLKSAGEMRIYAGERDQPRDPMMESVLQEYCPAFRGCAYVVFENLDLTDYGNRIPAMSFEVFASEGSQIVETLTAPTAIDTDASARFGELAGFAYDGGSLRDVIQLMSVLKPLASRLEADRLTLGDPATSDTEPLMLPEASSWEDGEFGTQQGFAAARSAAAGRGVSAVRYYDPARDFQPGIQHAENRSPSSRPFQFPGVLAASDALSLARQANARASVAQDVMYWRCATLDPAIGPGTIVRAPDIPGLFLVVAWEWREGGIELELHRHRPPTSRPVVADPGTAWAPADRRGSATTLRVFELPWDGLGNPDTRTVYAAATALAGRWSGAGLYIEQNGALHHSGTSATGRAIGGALAKLLESSNAIRFESAATLYLRLDDPDATLLQSDPAGMAQGANRLLVGNEILQYAGAANLGGGLWRLHGLLRGRGGTEPCALSGHPEGTRVTLLDERLTPLGEDVLASATGSFAAIGPWDDSPALAILENAGRSRQPPSPVHGSLVQNDDGSITLSWIRRARGQWRWPDEVDLPLIEETERYEVGFGPPSDPARSWTVASPFLLIAEPDIAALGAQAGGAGFWVRQIGSYAKSEPLLLGNTTKTFVTTQEKS